jgi:acyl-CoA thioesterase FadM
MVLRQTFYRNAQELVQIKLQLAFINPETMTPIRIPPDIKELFLKYQTHT